VLPVEAALLRPEAVLPASSDARPSPGSSTASSCMMAIFRRGHDAPARGRDCPRGRTRCFPAVAALLPSEAVLPSSSDTLPSAGSSSALAGRRRFSAEGMTPLAEGEAAHASERGASRWGSVAPAASSAPLVVRRAALTPEQHCPRLYDDGLPPRARRPSPRARMPMRADEVLVTPNPDRSRR
jgi:hypothetical protein